MHQRIYERWENNKLRASDIKRIVDVVTARESVCKFSRVVGRDEIRKMITTLIFQDMLILQKKQSHGISMHLCLVDFQFRK